MSPSKDVANPRVEDEVAALRLCTSADSIRFARVRVLCQKAQRQRKEYPQDPFVVTEAEFADRVLKAMHDPVK